MATVIYKLEDDISTDIIYPGRYMATVLPSETPQFAFVDISELNAMLNAMLNEGNPSEERIIIAGDNFGCGSSREQAVSTLKGHEVIIIAKHFARIFLQNSINLGLRTIICPDIEAETGDEIEVTDSKVINRTQGKEFAIKAMPESKKAVVDAGGLIPYTRKILVDGIS